MLKGRLMKTFIGGGIALFGLIWTMGAAGMVESGTVSIGSVAVRMAVGCVMVVIGAVVSGGLE